MIEIIIDEKLNVKIKDVVFYRYLLRYYFVVCLIFFVESQDVLNGFCQGFKEEEGFSKFLVLCKFFKKNRTCVSLVIFYK